MADAPDLGSGVPDVQVQVLLPAPRRSKLCIACSDFFSKVRARSRRLWLAANLFRAKRAAGDVFRSGAAQAAAEAVRGQRLFYQKVTSHAFCRSSFPNRTRFAGLRFGFLFETQNVYYPAPTFFQKSERAHDAAPPFRKRSRSRRLFACKRAHDGFGSLPTFFGRNASRGMLFVLAQRRPLWRQSAGSDFFSKV